MFEIDPALDEEAAGANRLGILGDQGSLLRRSGVSVDVAGYGSLFRAD